MGCWCSPYTFPGHKGALWSRWGCCGRFTMGGHGAFWQHSARPGHCGAGGGRYRKVVVAQGSLVPGRKVTGSVGNLSSLASY